MFFLQLDFSDDIVKIIQAAINSDGGQPEIKKANSMVKSFFIRVSETTVILRSPLYHTAVCSCWNPKCPSCTFLRRKIITCHGC